MKYTRSLSFDDVLLRPQKTPVSSRDDVDLSTRFTRNVKLDIPLVSANMSSVTETEMANAMREQGGLGVIHRFNGIHIREQMLPYTPYPNAVAIGLEEIESIVDIAIDENLRSSLRPSVFVVDVAHAHATKVIENVLYLNSIDEWDFDIMVGNIATAEAARELCEAGADGLKVGIGPSPVCRTRDVAGAGVGQLTAIHEVAQVAQEYSVPVCADGGMSTSGHIVKALATGASTIMSGSLFVGCDESPAREVKCNDGVIRKEYFGSASNQQKEGNDYIEGTMNLVDKTGPVADTVKTLCDGIRSGISYGGGRNISEMQDKAHFEVVR